MATRAETYIYEGTTGIACIYKHYDGYPSGHGMFLAEFLNRITVINGIGRGRDVLGVFANGIGCLAAQLVAAMKDAVGDVYLQPFNGEGNVHVDYIYRVYFDEDFKCKIVVASGGNPEILFEGDVEAFFEFCKQDGE